MERLTIREFRKALTDRNREPVIEIVRYHETVGYYLTKEEYERLSKKGKRGV